MRTRKRVKKTEISNTIVVTLMMLTEQTRQARKGVNNIFR